MKKKPKVPKPPIGSTRKLSLRASTKALTDSPSKSKRIDRPFPLPSYVKEGLQILHEAGHVAYLVGGCVRDFLLGHETKDYDIATSALPEEIVKLFPQSILVGKAFGVLKVPFGTHLLEIATFRKDLEYHDYRRPKGVVFAGIVEDAERRDFTINALFYDPKTSRILDPTGGIEDLKAKIIRAIGVPEHRFQEDALRLLRAVRFKTRLGFELEETTAQAIRAKAKLISKVSHERIRDELTLMWIGGRPAEALKLLSDFGLLSHILPELEALKGIAQIPASHENEDVWSHLLKTLEYLTLQTPVRSSAISWATVLHEVGKPIASQLSQGKNFNGHEIESAKLVSKIAARLKMSRQESDRIVAMVSNHLKFRDVFQMREATLLRWLQEDYFRELLAFHKADATASDGNLAFYEFCQNRLEALDKSAEKAGPKLIDGKDLIQLGFQPSPEFSEILRVIEDLTLEKKLSTKEEALEYVIKTFVR